FGLPERLLPRGERAREPPRRGRDVVVSGDREERNIEPPEEGLGIDELVSPTAVRDVAADDEELRLELGRELAQGRERSRRLVSAQMEVGDMDDARCHGRMRLYTRIVADESPEIFDDVYLGLRAGGAVRKQRRGEPLSAEEEEAIGRWRRLSI